MLTTTLMSLARGEFTAAEYGTKAKKSGGRWFSSRPDNFYNLYCDCNDLRKIRRINNRNIRTGRLPFWMLMSMMNSGRGSHSGSWGGFSGAAAAEEASAALEAEALAAAEPAEAGNIRQG